MTLADPFAAPADRIGNAVFTPTTDPRWHKEIQRAEGDGSGSPVGGTSEILTILPAMQTLWLDVGQFSPLDSSKTYIYRYRIMRVGASDGSWSSWSEEKDPTRLEEQLRPPQDARGIFRTKQGALVSEVISRLTDTGGADQDFKIGGFPFNSHTEQQSALDTDSPTFNQDYSSTPKVHFVPQRARSYLEAQPNADQRIKMSAVNPSASSFDLKAVVEYGSTTTTDHDDGFSASRNASSPENGGAAISAEGADIYCNLEDADGSDNDFLVTYDIDTTGVTSDEVAALAIVHIEYSDAATGGTWTEAGTQSYGQGQDLTDEQFSFSAELGPNYDIRLRLTYSAVDAQGEAVLTGHGEDGTPPGVQFSTNDSALTEASMTPRSTDKVYWEAKEVSA